VDGVACRVSRQAGSGVTDYKHYALEGSRCKVASVMSTLNVLQQYEVSVATLTLPNWVSHRSAGVAGQHSSNLSSTCNAIQISM
jgi:hypothetical protein